MKKLLYKLLGISEREVKSRQDEERIKFSEEVRKQLLQLKKKGLSIPVFTL